MNFWQRQREAQWAWPRRILVLLLFLSIFVSVLLSVVRRKGAASWLRAVIGDTDTVQQQLVFNGGVCGQTRAAIRRLASVSSRFTSYLCMRFMHRTLCIMNSVHLLSRYYTGKARTSRCSRSQSRAKWCVEPVRCFYAPERRRG